MAPAQTYVTRSGARGSRASFASRVLAKGLAHVDREPATSLGLQARIRFEGGTPMVAG